MKSRLILILCSIFLSVSTQKNDDYLLKRTYLNSRSGFMKLGSHDWVYKSDDQEFLMATKISSKAKSGRLLSVICTRGEGQKVFELRVSLNEGTPSVDLLDDSNESIITLPFEDHVQSTPNMEEMSIGVRLNGLTQELVYSIGEGDDMIASINKKLDLTGSTLEVILGSEDGTSLIGCVSLLSLSLSSSSLPTVHTIAHHDTQLCSTAGNECAERDCGKGSCLELETATCDCFGTGKAGPNCRSDSPSARMNAIREDTLKYTPINGERGIERIGMRFRLDGNGVHEGVLLSAALPKMKRTLTVYVVNGKGSIQVGSNQLVFDFDNTLKDHIFLVTFVPSIKSIHFKVDQAEEKQLQVNCQEEKCFEIAELYIGSESTDKQVSRIGITGCIWDVFVDHHNLVEMHYNGDERVETTQDLTRCNGDKEEKIYAIHDHPTSLISQSLPQVQEAPGQLSEPKVHTGSILPAPKTRDDDFPSTPCSVNGGEKCMNGGTCVNKAGARLCLCHNGFAGKNCEFSSIPRSCAEAHDFYRIPDGPTLIDVDESGPLPKSVVDCKNGVTTIINDVPNNTVVHDTTEQHSQFIVSYRDFTPQQVAMMVIESGECTQAVEYQCARAALGFTRSKTQFILAGSNRTIAGLGPHEGVCSNTDRECTCEGDFNGMDDGVFRSPDVGITKILAFRDNKISNQKGVITVGPLECRGHPGVLTPIRFSAPAEVQLDKTFESQMSFHFRTSSSQGTIVTTAGGVAVRIKNEYTLSLSVGDQEVTVQSSLRLNTTSWHLVIVEILNGQIRLSIDDVMTVADLEGEDVKERGQISLGNANDGFIGCLRSFRLNRVALDLHQETLHTETNELHLTCPDKCSADLCKNEADCIENLTDASAEPVCECKIPTVQQGANCEIDINKTPPVSFHGGHLKYEDLQNSLTGEIVLSFRTDQQQGLILFAHDHLNNFLQLHLVSETRVQLTLNNQKNVWDCTVEAEPGKEYSDMEWVQVVIMHSDKYSILNVNGRQCQIPYPREISQTMIDKYGHVQSDFVIIPVGIQTGAPINPYLLTYLGGVKEQVKKDGQYVVRPHYSTPFNDFLGCVRGFRVGGHLIDLTHTTKGTRSDPDLVQIGCEKGCSALACSNGGHCGVQWENFHPTANKVSCNCERTSYYGEQCDKDDSISISNDVHVRVNIKKYLEHYLSASRANFQTLKLAFKSNGNVESKQTIAMIHFEDNSYFEILLNKNGSVQVGSIRGDKAEVLIFPGNYSDGYRHFIEAQFKNDSRTAVLVDSTRHDFSYVSINFDLFWADFMILGADLEYTDTANFEGCISNVELDYQGYGMKIRPIGDLYNLTENNHRVSHLLPETVTIDSVRLESCGQFKEPDHLPGLSSSVDFPVWDTNFQRLVYNGLWLEGGEENSSFPWWIIILLVLIIAVIVGLFVYLICIRRKDDPKTNPSQGTELKPVTPENRPLISEPKQIPKPPSSNYDIPRPDMNLPNDEPEKSSDDEDWDRTITEENIQRPDDLGLPPPPSFNRSMHTRLSSFKRSDPTVPINSPLYVSRYEDDRPEERRSPKPVPPPRLL